MPKISQVIAVFILIAVAVMFSLWQWYEYQADVAAAREVLHGHAEGLCRAMVGAIRSHRRLGAFFDQQIQIILDELVDSPDVLAVQIADSAKTPIFRSGSSDVLTLSVGGSFADVGYVYSASFQLAPLAAAGPQGGARGFGWGRWARGVAPEPDTSPFASGGLFYATVVLDRKGFDNHVRRIARSRAGLCLTGWIALLLFGLTFRSSVRMVKADHAKRLAELQARHFEELSQAASGLAHETRNPLGLIRGRAQRIAHREDPTSPTATDARLIVEECDRLTARLTQFLLFAKPFTLQPVEVDADVVIEEVLLLLEPDCQSKDVRCVHHKSPQSVPIVADRELTRQALFNLLHNAVKYTRPHSEITVISRVDGSNIIIEIIDQGPGVSPEHIPKLFMPYFSTDSAGTGLGLSLVRKIAVAHGWDISYCPSPEGGAMFRLTIPLKTTGSGTHIGEFGHTRR